jgi:hypothetical protein
MTAPGTHLKTPLAEEVIDRRPLPTPGPKPLSSSGKQMDRRAYLKGLESSDDGIDLRLADSGKRGPGRERGKTCECSLKAF